MKPVGRVALISPDNALMIGRETGNRQWKLWHYPCGVPKGDKHDDNPGVPLGRMSIGESRFSEPVREQSCLDSSSTSTDRCNRPTDHLQEYHIQRRRLAHKEEQPYIAPLISCGRTIALLLRSFIVPSATPRLDRYAVDMALPKAAVWVIRI
ncbi:hypothetical protein BJV78DRAFT_1207603 [Lactifluus subvellereus]|nr:hypothetical protein BJV78DRAFT_1207603 [Lactifluus subvellereus]